MKADPEIIDELAATIQSATDAIDTALTKLETVAGGLAWSGTAKAAYEHAQAQWSAVLVELNAILKESRSIASQSGVLFRQVELEAAALWT